MTPQSLLAEAILACKPHTARYLAGFNSSNHTRQAPGLPNHVAWTLGHCALTMHRAAERIDAAPLPPEDFAPGTPARPVAGDRFAVESVAFGSAPTDTDSLYPGFARCAQVYGNAVDRLAAAVAAADDAALERTVTWGQSTTMPFRQLAARMVFHNGMHTGQIADLRRALGMGSIFV